MADGLVTILRQRTRAVPRFETVLNVLWVVLGAGGASMSWQLGVVGPAGPESGLFPLLASLIVAGSGVALLISPSHQVKAPAWPVGSALGRVLGVVLGLIVMALGLPYLGFAATGAITMLILLRAVERTSWIGSLALAGGSVTIVVWLFGHVLGMALPRGPWGW